MPGSKIKAAIASWRKKREREKVWSRRAELYLCRLKAPLPPADGSGTATALLEEIDDEEIRVAIVRTELFEIRVCDDFEKSSGRTIATKLRWYHGGTSEWYALPCRHTEDGSLAIALYKEVFGNVMAVGLASVRSADVGISATGLDDDGRDPVAGDCSIAIPGLKDDGRTIIIDVHKRRGLVEALQAAGVVEEKGAWACAQKR